MAAAKMELPCDGEGICMVCKEKPMDEDTVSCKTCNTPWHLLCLSSAPQTLEWECPDCSPRPDAAARAPAHTESSDLVASIRAIEADETLTDGERAKRRQELMSKGKESVLSAYGIDLLGGNLNCSFCMQVLDRPVTTPCGHNFCLKCFLKWTGQGKRTCAKCRSAIPSKMATQPRINSSLVLAIRMARMSTMSRPSKPATLKVHYFIQNQNRPDKAFLTDRAKKAGKANACSGKIFVTVPSDHFGPILAQNDPERNQGVLVGESWEDRMECRQWGVHLPHVSGIAGQSDYGAQSVALSGGYQDDEDHGEWFLYTGSGGRDLSGNKRTNKEQSFDQKFDKYNEALRVSCKKGYPVRVVRSHKEKRTSYAPETGVRYDGIYRIEKCWRKVGIQGFKVCRYLFVRCDNEPAPWTTDEHGDKPRPLPVIKELKKATDITERTEKPSWDYDQVEGWTWKRPPPVSRKPKDNQGWQSKLPPMSGEPIDTAQLEERRKEKEARKQEQNLHAIEKLLKGFTCPICHKVMTSPLTTPCAHNFCKPCLEGAFAGQTFLRERTCEGRRALRTQKNIMKCPSCITDISDFLQNPQINRELMDVIESLRSKTEVNVEDSSKEGDATEDKLEAGVGEPKIVTESVQVLESINKAVQNGPIQSKSVSTIIDCNEKQVCPMKKCDTLDTDKRDGVSENTMPVHCNGDLGTPTPVRMPKRKKLDTDNCVSTSGGVRTRSMKAKELAEGIECGSVKGTGMQVKKRKKAGDTDSGVKLGGVSTRRNRY